MRACIKCGEGIYPIERGISINAYGTNGYMHPSCWRKYRMRGMTRGFKTALSKKRSIR